MACIFRAHPLSSSWANDSLLPVTNGIHPKSYDPTCGNNATSNPDTSTARRGQIAATMIIFLFVAAWAWSFRGNEYLPIASFDNINISRNTVAVFAAFFGAGFAQASAGFGAGIILMSILSAVMTVQEATPIVNIFTSFTAILIIIQHRHAYNRQLLEPIPPLIVGQIFGSPVGVYTLLVASPSVLHLIFGLVAIVFSIHQVLARVSFVQDDVGSVYVRLEGSSNLPRNDIARHCRKMRWGAICCGALSGFLSGSLSMGGPPALAYFLSTQADKDKIKAPLQAFFAITGIYSFILQAALGIFHVKYVLLDAVGLFVAWLGVLVGTMAYERLDNRRFGGLTLVALLLIGIVYLMWSILDLTQ